MSDRDYADLKNDKIAVYNFRGYTVLRFDKESKALEIGKHADMCCFVEEDIHLMSCFLERCYGFSKGWITEIDNVEVD